ncbi:MAG TPA: hypothetical protein VD905_16650 [Flavobacteriales bacterium]|nr:hypothetical protein [Flavobacteriales bacterium]
MDKQFIFLQVFFGLTTLLSLVLFIRASAGYKKWLWIVLGLWVLVQGLLSYNGFYLNNMTMPPRFALLLAPPLAAILLTVLTRGGRRFIDQLNPAALTLMHTVRVPVEFTLLWLCMFGLVPEVMTFEGRNFDIISGLTAPLMAWLIYKQKASKGLLMAWNLVCLGLVLNVVIHGLLSAPSPFTQLFFEVPNTGVLMFPFTWLPGLIVPLVLFSHVACLIKLFRK